MRRLRWLGLAGAMAVAFAAPVAAQFSDSYNFMKAVRDGDGQKVTEFLDKPGTVIVNTKSDEGDTALHIVTKRRDLTWIQFLIAKGAKTDVRDRDGNTPLAVAARLGFAEGVKYLSLGGVVNLANSRGETPLIFATQARDIVMVRTLLGAGANPKQADRVTGKSALDYATEDRRSTAIVKLLQESAGVKKPLSGPVL